MSENALNVLILAAGLGTRLRPLTNDIPKPLVPVVDVSILELQAKKASSLGNICLHVNAHYLPNKIVLEANRLNFEKVWLEPKILGTAGPIKRIFDAGYRGGLLVMNGDAFCNFDLKKFVENSRKVALNSNAQVSLLALDFPKINTFCINENSRLSGIVDRFGTQTSLRATFSGISWYSDLALSRIRSGEFDIREFWRQEILSGNAPFVDMSQKNSTWIDMGSPLGLKAACFSRLDFLGKNSWIASNVKCKNIEHSIIYAGVDLPQNATITNSILYPGAVVQKSEVVSNEIRGKNFTWNV